MNKLPATEFEKGFICAVSIMFRSHGLGVAATEALRDLGAERIDPMSIDEADRETLVRFQKEGTL